MESWSARDCENESPSQENLAHLQTIKRDGESLEDFEDITKDEPTMKDLTAQFLQFETGEKNKHIKELVFQDDLLDSESKSSGYINIKSSNERVNQTLKDLENLVILEPSSSEISDREETFNNIRGLKQTDMQPEEDLEKFEEKPTLNILNENKLINVSSDEISTDSYFSSNVPKKEESSVQNSDSEKDLFIVSPSESKPEDFFNTQPLLKFTSEPDKNNEQELEVLQGDGLHVKQFIQGEVSDNDDDYIPEPIPKDYPEIGAIEGKQFLAAIGLAYG